jgi:hypothetical protein
MASMARIIIIIVVLSLIVAAIILATKYLKYRRHINDVLNGVEDKSKRISSPESTLIGVLIVILILWNGINLGMITSLQSSVNNLSNKISDLNRDMSIYSEDIAGRFKYVNSVVCSSNVVFVGVDMDSRTVELETEVKLRQFSDDTKATLFYGPHEVEMKNKGNGTFTATVNYGIFDVCEGDPTVVVETDGVKNAAELETFYYGPFWNDLFPEIYAAKLPWDVKLKNGHLTIKDEMWFLRLEGKDILHETEAYLVGEINGNEVSRTKLDIDQISFDKHLTVNVDEEYDLGPSDAFAYYIETKNSAGFTLKRLAWYYVANSSDDCMGYYDFPADVIFDSNGKILFSE